MKDITEKICNFNLCGAVSKIFSYHMPSHCVIYSFMHSPYNYTVICLYVLCQNFRKRKNNKVLDGKI